MHRFEEDYHRLQRRTDYKRELVDNNMRSQNGRHLARTIKSQQDLPMQTRNAQLGAKKTADDPEVTQSVTYERTTTIKDKKRVTMKMQFGMFKSNDMDVPLENLQVLRT